MSKEIRKISFDEFSDNLTVIFNRVIQEHEPVFVESESGELVAIKAVPSASKRRKGKTKEDYEAFLASAGGWADVDIDTFLKENEESRNLNTRPPVEL